MPQQPSGTRVFASYATTSATSDTATASWVDVAFESGRTPSADGTTATITALDTGQAISAMIRAYATTAGVLVRVLARVDKGYDWIELVASTAVAIAAPSGGIVSGDTEILADTIRYEAIRVQVMQDGGGGTATISMCLK